MSRWHVSLFIASTLACAASIAAGPQLDPPAIVNHDALFDDLRHEDRPQIATTHDGTWICFWQQTADTTGTLGFDTEVFAARSTDDGRTWGVSFALNDPLADDPQDGADDMPALTANSTGVVLAAWSKYGFHTPNLDRDIIYRRSTDSGATWSPMAPIHSNAAAEFQTDAFTAILLDESGTAICAWSSGNPFDGAGNDEDLLFVRSTDHGATWSAPAALNTNHNGDTGADYAVKLATDGSGTWVAVWESSQPIGGSGTDFDILFSRSTDDGLTWSAPALLNSNAVGDSLTDQMAGVAADGAGNWMAVWTTEQNLGGTDDPDEDIVYSRSTDNGATWSPLAPVKTNSLTDGFESDTYGSIVCGPGNTWVVSWQRNPSSNFESVFAYSNDLGATWSDTIDHSGDAPVEEGNDLEGRTAVSNAGVYVRTYTTNDVASGVSGMDGDLVAVRFFFDSTAPASSATAAAGIVGTTVSVDFTATDDGTVANTELYVLLPGGTSLVPAGLAPQAGTAGTFTYTATASGVYGFATRATDGAGNIEPLPAEPDAIVAVNITPNDPFTHTIAPGPNGTYTFPMEAGLFAIVTFDSATSTGTLTVQREEGDFAPTGYSATQFVDERWHIAPAGGLAFTHATLQLGYDEALLGGLTESSLRFAARELAPTVQLKPIDTLDTAGNRATIEGVTEFSTWYLGDPAASAENWNVWR